MKLEILNLFFIILIKIANSYNCSWHYGTNVSYNLCNLQLSNLSQFGSYTVDDKRSTANVSQFFYEFNICDNVADDPEYLTVPTSICTNLTIRNIHGLPLGYCNSVVNYTCKDYPSSIVNITKPTAAYQIKNSATFESCYRLHNGITEPTWSLYQSDDPVKGVVLTYTNGDWCPISKTSKQGRNREFRIAFICDNNYENIFDKQEVTEEIELCVYETSIKSVWGCPEQCKVVNEQLCGGNGICDYDFTNKYPRCFCYTGYYGADCSSLQDDNVSTMYKDDDAKYVGLLIIVVILLVIVLTIFFYLWLRFTSTKYMIPKGKSLISKSDDNKSKRDKKQKQQSEVVHDDSDEENNVVV